MADQYLVTEDEFLSVQWDDATGELVWTRQSGEQVRVPVTSGLFASKSTQDTVESGRLSAESIVSGWEDMFAANAAIPALAHGISAVATGSFPTLAADSATALNALIAAVSDSGGGTIQLPPGEIRVDTPIVPKSNVMLRGAGMGKTIIYTLQYGFLHTDADPSSVLTNFHLRDVTVDGARNGDTVTWKGWHGQYHDRCSWVDVEFKNFGMTGLGPDYLRDCYAMRVRIENTGRANDGTQPSGNGIGFAVGGSWLDGVTEENFVVIGCHIHGAKRFGIMWEGGAPNTAGAAYGGAVVIGNTITGCGSGGINASGGRDAVIQGNYVYRNIGHGILIGQGTLPNSAPGWRALVSGNQVYKNGLSGIVYDESLHAKLGDMCTIIGNSVSENTEHGILVKTGLSHVAGIVVRDNTLHLNTLAGLLIKIVGAFEIRNSVFDNNLFYNNWPSLGSYTASQIGQLLIEGGTLADCSISGNMFGTTGTRQSMCLGNAASPTVLTSAKIHGNKRSGTVVLIQKANATLTTCDIRNNAGYVDVGPATQGIGSSPFTYTAGSTPEVLYVSDGTVTSIEKNGITLAAFTNVAVPLEPNQQVVITYSAAPTLVKDRLQ